MLGIFFLFITGLFLLIFGAELFVKGTTSTSRAIGISPLFIGLTVVALGTSLPEIFVTTVSVLRGAQSLAIGNIIGSNLANLLLIGGGSAIIGELIITRSIVYFHGPTMVGLTAVGYVLSSDGSLTRFEGVWLLMTFLCYTTLAIYIEGEQGLQSHYPKRTHSKQEDTRTRALVGNAAATLTGLILLLVGSDWLVQSATRFSRLAGLSSASLFSRSAPHFPN
jgi:cation:H+ antiporter